MLLRTAVALLAIAPAGLSQSFYALDQGASGGQLVRFDRDAPLNPDVIGSTNTSKVYAGFEAVNGKFYAVSNGNGSPLEFAEIDQATGHATVIGGNGLLPGDAVGDLSWSEVDGKLYTCGRRVNGAVTLYEVDVNTGTLTVNKTMPHPTSFGTLGLASHPVTGDLYVLDDWTNKLHRIDNGALVPLPNTVGYDPFFIQGMTFDVSTNELLIGSWNHNIPRSELRLANLTTGGTTVLGFIGEIATILPVGIAWVPAAPCNNPRFCNPASGSLNNTATIDINRCDLVHEVRVTLGNAPAGQFCYLVIGDGSQPIQPPGTVGDLCLSGGTCLARYVLDVGQIQAGGTFETLISNSATAGPDFEIPVCPGRIEFGETWNFQYWHRQPGGQPSTFSEAMQVTFR